MFLQGLALSLLAEGESDISYSVHILLSEAFAQDSVTYSNYSLPIHFSNANAPEKKIKLSSSCPRECVLGVEYTASAPRSSSKKPPIPEKSQLLCAGEGVYTIR